MVTLRDMLQFRCMVVVTVIVHVLGRISASRCMFDVVKPRRVVQAEVSYSSIRGVCISNDGRCKRGASDKPIAEDLFQPIRIHAYFSSTTEINIDAIQRTRLTTVIDRIVSSASHIFSGKFLHSACII